MATVKKTIGRIPYSLGARKSKPNAQNSEKKVYAYVQSEENVGMAALAQHMTNHNSVYSPGTIYGVLTDMASCIKELLLEGNRVTLDGLATFYLTLKSDGAASADSFSDAMIKRVNIRTSIDPQFRDDVNSKAQFEKVASRQMQAQSIKENKQSVDETVSASVTGGDSGGEADPGDVTP